MFVHRGKMTANFQEKLGGKYSKFGDTKKGTSATNNLNPHILAESHTASHMHTFKFPHLGYIYSEREREKC